MKNKFRATLSLILCIVFMATAFVPCVTAFADNREIIASGTSSEVNWTLYDDGELIISGKGDMNDYSTSSTAPWYSYRDSISNVIISENISSIGAYAFYNCLKITSVSIPESVTEIKNCAFRSCSNLENISIPNSVINLGNNVFYSCKKLINIELSDLITYIPPYTFASCSNLKEIDLNSCSVIGSSAFESCTKLETVILSGTTKTIGEKAFKNCRKLVNIDLPQSLNYINAQAFYDCESLKDISLPESLIRIEKESFYGCIALESIIIPDGITSISRGVFQNCENLKSVVLPDSVTSIESYAFKACKALTTISIPDNLTRIGMQAFYQCINLECNINISKTLTTIGDGAFEICNSIKSFTVDSENPNYSSDENGVLFNKDKTTLLQYPAGNQSVDYSVPDSVKEIGDYAFWASDSLENITIPDTIEYIGEYAFTHSGFSNNLANWDNGFLYLDNYLIAVNNTEIPSECKLYSKTKLIAEKTFYNNDSITKVTMSDDVEYINNSAFYDCNNLQAIHLSDSLKSIGEYAFYGCSALSDINVPKNVTLISEKTFSNCSSLESVVLNEGLCKIESMAFASTPALTEIHIPQAVTTLASDAFKSSGITDIHYGDTKAQWKRLANGATFNDATIHYTLRSEDESVIINHTDDNFDFEAGNVHLVVEDLGNATSSYEQNGFYNRLLVDPIQVLDIKLVDGDGNSVQPLPDEKITVKIKASDEFMNMMKSGLASVSEHDVEASEIDFENDCFVLEINGETVRVPAPDKFLKKFKVIHWYSDAVQPTDHEGFKHDEITVKDGYIIIETNHFSEFAVCTDLTALEDFTVKWIIDGAVTEQTVMEGDVLSTPENPEKEGYTFIGWTPEVPAKMPAENLEFTAVWQANEYTITFDTAGGTEIAPITLESGAKITAPANPEKEGYTFIGWSPEIPETMPKNDLTVVAVYEKADDSASPEDPAATVTGIKVINLPNKTRYAYKENNFDLSGIAVEIMYSDGSSKITSDTNAVRAYGFSTDSVGTKTITVAYGNFTDEFEITVSYSWWQWIIRILMLGFLWY